MITKEKKKLLIKEYGALFASNEQDSGSSAVQVAILTQRITDLKEHFDYHIHDYHSNRGLLKMIGQRRSLLRYIQKKDSNQYKALIKKLGLRK